jgi:hypothetical protein
MPKKILIYSNCHGSILAHMFATHPLTKLPFSVSFISNYEELQNETLSPCHQQLISECDFFIYQPFNKTYENTEYDIGRIRERLQPSCVVFRINYYRFKGFWFESSLKPYTQYGYYKFINESAGDFGLHDSFSALDSASSLADVREKVDRIKLDEPAFTEYFQTETDKFRGLDLKSDVKMYDFFIANYRDTHLFHDGFHPTTRFFYEVFRQTLETLFQISIPTKDAAFVTDMGEITTWAQPVLPIIKKTLNMTTPDTFYLFDGCYGTKILLLDVYDYYYIRLSTDHLEEYIQIR